MKSISFHPHIADVRLKIKAGNLPELFEAGLLGMGHLLNRNACKNMKLPNRRQLVRIESPDLTALLIDFLSEVLTLSYLEEAVYCQVKTLQLTERKFKGEIEGVPVISFDEDIKAVTYHEAQVKHDPQRGWQTVIIFDI